MSVKLCRKFTKLTGLSSLSVLSSPLLLRKWSGAVNWSLKCTLAGPF